MGELYHGRSFLKILYLVDLARKDGNITDIMKGTENIYVVLDNIRSVHNVGSIFRTSDCAGVQKIYLCGTTPTPLDRFGRERKDFKKVSLGAEKSVAWQYWKSTMEAVLYLTKEGVNFVAVEQDDKSIDYREIPIKENTAFVFGAEVEGVSKEILKMCDTVAEIPLRGKKESLNVSVTAGIILFASRCKK